MTTALQEVGKGRLYATPRLLLVSFTVTYLG